MMMIILFRIVQCFFTKYYYFLKFICKLERFTFEAIFILVFMLHTVNIQLTNNDMKRDFVF